MVAAPRGGDVDTRPRWVCGRGGRGGDRSLTALGHPIATRGPPVVRPCEPQARPPPNPPPTRAPNVGKIASDNPRQPPADRHCAQVGPRTTRVRAGGRDLDFSFLRVRRPTSGGRVEPPRRGAGEHRARDAPGRTSRAGRSPIERVGTPRGRLRRPGGRLCLHDARMRRRTTRSYVGRLRAATAWTVLSPATGASACARRGVGNPLREIVAEPHSCVQSFARLGHQRRMARRVEGPFQSIRTASWSTLAGSCRRAACHRGSLGGATTA